MTDVCYSSVLLLLPPSLTCVTPQFSSSSHPPSYCHSVPVQLPLPSLPPPRPPHRILGMRGSDIDKYSRLIFPIMVGSGVEYNSTNHVLSYSLVVVRLPQASSQTNRILTNNRKRRKFERNFNFSWKFNIFGTFSYIIH